MKKPKKPATAPTVAPTPRQAIVRYLTKVTEATQAQITTAIGMIDYPSRVTRELNAMRTDALLECEKKKGKGNELWYWLSQPATNADASVPQPAVGDNTGSRVAASMPPAADATVQPKPAPAATVPPTAAPAAADENYSLLGVLADIRAAVGDKTGKIMLSELAEHIRLRLAELDAAPAALRAELKKADDELAEIQAALAGRVYIVGDLDELPSAAQCATRAAAVIDQLTSANREHLNMLAIASETLAAVVHGAIDTSDMDLDELSKWVAESLIDSRRCTEVAQLARENTHAENTRLVAELANQTALVEKLEHLLQSARNEAEHLRRHANHSGAAADMVNHPPHYQGKVECIDAIEAALGPTGFVAYCRGNALKYTFRAGRKGPAQQDMAKAAWYTARAIATTENSSAA